MPVTVNLGFHIFSNVPLFFVIIVSLLTGLILSYLVSLVSSFSNFFTLRGKNKEIKKNKNEVLELTKRVHQLELENEKLRTDTDREPEDKNAL
jgi:cell shape-determining protein MreC